MAYLSIRDAAKLLGRDERTIRRWIENGTLAAIQGANGRMVISEEEIARVQALMVAPEQEESDLAQRVQVLEEKVARLEQALAERTREPEKQVVAPDRSRKYMTHPALPNLPTSAHPGHLFANMMGDLVVAPAFAKQHFPADPTLPIEEQKKHDDKIAQRVNRLCDRNEIHGKGGKWATGKSYAKWALDAQGRARFHELNHTMPGFQECDDCPHYYSEEKPSSSE